MQLLKANAQTQRWHIGSREMASNIVHFSHNHPLIKLLDVDDYVCKSCMTPGSGERYRCNPCNFDLHVFCAASPRVLTSSHFHPYHSLEALLRVPEESRSPAHQRTCHVCGKEVQGFFYWCRLCDFNVHPLCTQWPLVLRHESHLQHPLSLLPSGPKPCSVCNSPCEFWGYRCEPCGVDLHHDCAVRPYKPNPMPLPPPPSPAVGYSTGTAVASYGTPQHHQHNPYQVSTFHNPNLFDASMYSFGPGGGSQQKAKKRPGIIDRAKMAARVLKHGIPGMYSSK